VRGIVAGFDTIGDGVAGLRAGQAGAERQYGGEEQRRPKTARTDAPSHAQNLLTRMAFLSASDCEFPRLRSTLRGRASENRPGR
jgi:hypothetical protein